MKQALLLAGWLAAGGPASAGSEDGDRLGTVITYPAESKGPALAVRPQAVPGLVAIRLAVQVHEPPEMAGAVALLQEAWRRHAAREAAEQGARLSAARTATHAVYEAVGPADAFGALVALLREAVAPPRMSGRELESLWVAVHTRAAVELETPEPLVRRRLRERLLPETVSPVAVGAAVRAPPFSALRAFWARNYRPERMQAVVVGAVQPEDALAAFRGWDAPPEPPDLVNPFPPREAVKQPQVIFPWAALAYPAAGIEPAVLAVAAVLLERRLRDANVASGRAELWWTDQHRSLVVVASTRPRSADAPVPTSPAAAAAELQDRLRATIAETAALMEADEVLDARRALRRDLLLAARSPQGLAMLLGEFMERTGDANEAQRFLAALKDVQPAQVRRALVALMSTDPVTVEVLP